MQLIKDNQVIEDGWSRPDTSGLSADLPDGDMIIPFNFWLEHKNSLKSHNGELAICINGDDDIESVVEYLDQFKLIALDFPAFKDGRCYSHARLLRDRYQFQGELRAVGDVLRDQLFFMKRCGIDSFQVREDTDIQEALKGFADFSIKYQTAADGAEPVYKSR